MNKERIKLEDTTQDIIVKMSDGNPGAINAMVKLLTLPSTIDPKCAWGPIGPFISLDTNGIYGADIYILYNTHCNQNAHKLAVLLRASQLGIFPSSKLKKLAGDQCMNEEITQEEWGSIVEELNKQLPSLNTNF